MTTSHILRIHTNTGRMLFVLIGVAATLLSPSRTSAQQPPWNTTSIGYYVSANYITVLGRAPDPSGWQWWTSSLNQWDGYPASCNGQNYQSWPGSPVTNPCTGTNYNDALTSTYFLGSQEYQTKYGTLSNSQFATNLCQNSFNKPAGSCSEYNGWVSQLNNGTASRTAVAENAMGSSDFNNEYGPVASTYCSDSAIPTPGYTGLGAQSVSAYTATPVTVNYTNNTCGNSNISWGYIEIASTTDTTNGTLTDSAGACDVQWDSAGNLILYDYAVSPAASYSGHAGAAGTLSASHCSVRLQGSSVAPTAGGLLSVQLDLVFLANFVGQHAVWTQVYNNINQYTPRRGQTLHGPETGGKDCSLSTRTREA